MKVICFQRLEKVTAGSERLQRERAPRGKFRQKILFIRELIARKRKRLAAQHQICQPLLVLLVYRLQLIVYEFALVIHKESVAAQKIEKIHAAGEQRQEKRGAREGRARFEFGAQFPHDGLRPFIRARVADPRQFVEKNVFDLGNFPFVYRDVGRGDDIEKFGLREPFARDEIVRFYLFHAVPEEIHAGGIFRIDRKNIQNIAAQRERALAFHRRGAGVTHLYEFFGQGRKINFFSHGQRERFKTAGKELQQALDIAYDDARAVLDLVQGVDAIEQRVVGNGVFI